MEKTQINGQKVVLRLMEEEDTASIIKWRNHKRVSDHFIYREAFTQEGHENWIRTMINTGKAVQFIICEKEDLRPVGSVYYRDIDEDKKEAEYGIFIGEDDAAGKGYGSETAKLAVAYAFDKMGMERLILRVFADNVAAVKSYEKAGFAKVCDLYGVECSDGEKKDMILMDIKKGGSYESAD